MCDSWVGNEIANWLFDCYLGDLGAVVTTAENDTFHAARNKGVPSFVFQSETQVASELDKLPSFDLGLLAWWPRIISERLIEVPEQGFINTHPSLLPHNRGKHYNFWALVEQAPFGVSLHFVDRGVDSGDVIAQQTIAYSWEDTGETLYVKARYGMVDLFKSAYPSVRAGTFKRTTQDLKSGTLHYAKEIEAASRVDLDKTYSARELFNLLRARTFPGHPACYFDDGGITYEITVNIKRKAV